MAFGDAKDIYLAFGTPSSEVVLAVSGTAGAITNVDGLDEDTNEHDVTTFGANAEVNQPGVDKGPLVKIQGYYSAAMETALGAKRNVLAQSLIYGPLGSTSGFPKKSSPTCYVKSFTTKAAAKGVVMFEATIRIYSGGVVRGTF